ncbi:12182_t:CDS:2 [Entrophospora sp. SA101]|nr:12182_t:CDS:2 [Entrophospora sp. SA101]
MTLRSRAKNHLWLIRNAEFAVIMEFQRQKKIIAHTRKQVINPTTPEDTHSNFNTHDPQQNMNFPTTYEELMAVHREKLLDLNLTLC